MEKAIKNVLLIQIDASSFIEFEMFEISRVDCIHTYRIPAVHVCLLQTSPTLASNLYCLARYPEAQEKVYQEVMRVVPPGSQITPKMINHMAYLKAFVKEAFRYSLHRTTVKIE